MMLEIITVIEFLQRNFTHLSHLYVRSAMCSHQRYFFIKYLPTTRWREIRKVPFPLWMAAIRWPSSMNLRRHNVDMLRIFGVHWRSCSSLWRRSDEIFGVYNTSWNVGNEIVGREMSRTFIYIFSRILREIFAIITISNIEDKLNLFLVFAETASWIVS